MQPSGTALQGVMALVVLIALVPQHNTAPAGKDDRLVLPGIYPVLEKALRSVQNGGQYESGVERYIALAEIGNRQALLNAANMYSKAKGKAKRQQCLSVVSSRLARNRATNRL